MGDPRVRIEPTRTNISTASVLCPDGRRVLLHSKYNPATEAQTFAQSATMDAATSCVILGLGLGYHVAALAERLHPQERILVIEKDDQIAAAARGSACANTILEDPRITLAIQPSPQDARNLLLRFMADIHGHDYCLIPHMPSVTLDPDYYGALEQQFTRAREMLIGDALTQAEMGKRYLANSVRNLPATVSAASVGCLRGLAKGRPAFVIAAGPSLDRNIEQLHGATHLGPILAVGTVSAVLAEHGIRPDLIVSVDPKPQTRDYFKNRKDLRDIPFVFEMEAAPDAVGFFTGARLLVGSDKPFCKAIQSFLPDLTVLPRGLSVAHYAFEVAHLMGADPIVLVGQDLAFGPNSSHAAGVASSWGEAARNDASTRVEVPGNSAPSVTTNQGFRACIRHYEDRIRDIHPRVINATEGGARIEGTETVPLAQVIESFSDGARSAWRSYIPDTATQAESGNMVAATQWLEQMRSLAQAACNQAATPSPQAASRLQNSPLLHLLEPAMAREIIEMKKLEKDTRRENHEARRRELEERKAQMFLDSAGRAASLFLAPGDYSDSV